MWLFLLRKWKKKLYQLFTGEHLFRVPTATIIRIFHLYLNSVEEWPMFVLRKHKYFWSHSGGAIACRHGAADEADSEHSIWVYLGGEGNTCKGVGEAGNTGASPGHAGPPVREQSRIPLGHWTSPFPSTSPGCAPSKPGSRSRRKSSGKKDVLLSSSSGQSKEPV